jgi:hypothetical protein
MPFFVQVLRPQSVYFGPGWKAGLHPEEGHSHRGGHKERSPRSLFSGRQVFSVSSRLNKNTVVLVFSEGANGHKKYSHRVTLKKRYGLLLTQQAGMLISPFQCLKQRLTVIS